MAMTLRLMAGAWALAFGALACFNVQAQPAVYPSRPIRLIVPFPAGGGTDFFARAVAAKMSEQMGQQIVIDNKPGAASMIGAQAAATSTPDGYTLLIGDMSTLAVNPGLYKHMSYDPLKDFAPVSLTARFDLLLVVNPTLIKATTVQQFIEEVKSSPKSAFYATASAGTAHHLIMELFEQQTGLKMTPVHYKGAPPAVQDVMAGQVPSMFLDLAVAGPFVKSGKLRAIAVASGQRIAALPDVPTAASGGFPGFDSSAWQALMAPAGTPRDIIARLNSEYAKAAADPVLRQKLADAGVEAVTSTPEECTAKIVAETAKWGKVIQAGDIRID